MKNLIEIGTKIKDSENEVFTIYSVRKDGKFYFTDIWNDEQFTGYVEEIGTKYFIV
jgi:hypothetical protein